MVCACIDIGSNTTRVLVAEAQRGRLTEVLQRRAFTRLGRGLPEGGRIPRAKIDEVVRVVDEQRRLAESAGAQALRAVATAAIRGAGNRDEVVDAVGGGCGVELTVLDAEEEARLAFLGATHAHAGLLDGAVGVVDVGGGSTEIAVGTVDDGVRWWGSVPVGSSRLTDDAPLSDPPTHAQLTAMDGRARAALAVLDIPSAGYAMGVGGSATSLRRLVGPVLDAESLARALDVLAAEPAAAVAERFAIEPERVALLPAGILVLAAAARRLGRELHVGCGGLREGVLLDLAGLR
ncbi:MAG: exopolyphosphatase / guanosine-5-triphosphate,3-diphosphate pyrophosphatase [Solirubrobacteraceae bacterium]|jgi:exopolyphosphatase/guanosine-5'-triphosphate,3'-diphosphate pyrophosphatase|nr:exopolyphosphatase / guanosine-5-triphosphate,3-diphosphate pyrophosphatase [Solirubrobacteraceae bacterium]